MFDDNKIQILKKELNKEKENFKNFCERYTLVIVIIYIVLVLVAMCIDATCNMEIGFTRKFSGKIILAILGILSLGYWLVKLIAIVIRVFFGGEEY